MFYIQVQKLKGDVTILLPSGSKLKFDILPGVQRFEITEPFFQIYGVEFIVQFQSNAPLPENSSNLFYGAKNLERILVDASTAHDVSGMFAGCLKLQLLPDSFSVSMARNVSSLFDSCISLKRLPPQFSVPLAINTTCMFRQCYQLESLPEGFSISSSLDSSFMFDQCYRIARLPDDFTPNKALRTNSMFMACIRLVELPDGFTIPESKDTSNMFSQCRKLLRIPQGFSAAASVNTSGMFHQCYSLGSVSLSTPVAINTSLMFYQCHGLTELVQGFNAPLTKDASYMFGECDLLESLPNGFSGENIVKCIGMFSGCVSLVELPESFDVPVAKDLRQMFTGCVSMKYNPQLSVRPDATTDKMYEKTTTDINVLLKDCYIPSPVILKDVNGMHTNTPDKQTVAAFLHKNQEKCVIVIVGAETRVIALPSQDLSPFMDRVFYRRGTEFIALNLLGYTCLVPSLNYYDLSKRKTQVFGLSPSEITIPWNGKLYPVCLFSPVKG